MSVKLFTRTYTEEDTEDLSVGMVERFVLLASRLLDCDDDDD